MHTKTLPMNLIARHAQTSRAGVSRAEDVRTAGPPLLQVLSCSPAWTTNVPGFHALFTNIGISWTVTFPDQDEKYAFAKEWLYGRELLEYQGPWAEAKVIHSSIQKIQDYMLSISPTDAQLLPNVYPKSSSYCMYSWILVTFEKCCWTEGDQCDFLVE